MIRNSFDVAPPNHLTRALVAAAPPTTARSRTALLPRRLGSRRAVLVSTALLALLVAGCGGPENSAEELGTDASAQSSGSVALSSFRLSSTSIPAGSSVDATVTLTDNASASSGGVNVYIAFPRGVLAGPRFVRIPNGARSATFTLHSNPYVSATTTASLSANTQSPQPFVSASQTLTITPPAVPPSTPRPEVASITLSPATVTNGASSVGTVTLTTPAPAAGAVVQLANSGDSTNVDADLPPVVIVPPGATTAAFTIRSHLSGSTSSYVQEIIVGNYFGGRFQGAYLTINR
jgi:hypothetical protein